MGDEAKGHDSAPRSLPNAGAAAPAEGIAEQAAQADRRKIVAHAAAVAGNVGARVNVVSMSTDELDELLDERFGLRSADMVAALRTLPAIKPGSAALSHDHARLLDLAGFGEDQHAYAAAAADTVVCLASLLRTAYSVSDVARALRVSQSRVRHRRLARTLWAIPQERSWIFPAMQFEADETTGLPLRQVRGLDQVLPMLPPDLHPVSVAGFLQTPQADLQVNRQPQSALDWLRTGGDIQCVIHIVEAAHWVGS